MRRRTFLASLAVGSAGLAGCSGDQRSTTSTGSPSTTAGSTTGSTRAQPTTATTRSETDPTTTTATGDTDAFEFGDDVGETTRTRLRRALDRVESMTGASLSSPIQVVEVDIDWYPARLSGLYGLLSTAVPTRLTPSDSVRIPGSLGYYSAGNRRLSIVDPEQVPETMFDDTDALPAVSFEGFPNEPFLAHELTHAVQYDAADVPPDPSAPAAATAHTGVIEGTADYVQGRYREVCMDGEYDPCRHRASTPGADATPIWLSPRRFPYVSGTAFAHTAVERGGWDLLWKQHRDPPETDWAIMFPDRYFEGGIDVRRVDPHPTVDGDLRRVTNDRLGVAPHHFLLWALGIVDGTATTDPAVDETTGVERVFRSSRLVDWRGDRMTVFATGDDRYPFHWTSTWADSSAAADLERALTDTYDREATADGFGWSFEDGYVAVGRSGERLELTVGPTKEIVRTIREAGSDG